MTDLDKGFPGNGAEPPRPEGRPMPYFPAPPSSGGPSTGGVPLAAPVPATPPGVRRAPAAVPAPSPPAPSESAGRSAPAIPSATSAAVVKGRITIEDQVIEKIATLAALEVAGVAGTAGCTARGEGGDPGVRIHPHDNEVSLDLAVAVVYGCVIMDVAKQVKAEVARVVSQMLGMRVVAVNVSVEDVRAPSPDG